MAMYKNLECRRNGTDLSFESRRNGSRRNGSRRNGRRRNGSRRNGNTPVQIPLLPKHAKFDLNFKHIAIFCGCTALFVLDLVGNPEKISRDAAQIIIKPLNVLLPKMFYYSKVSSHRAVIADYKVAHAVLRTY